MVLYNSLRHEHGSRDDESLWWGLQMAKVAVALLEGRTENPAPAPESDSANGSEPLAVKPQTFKRLVGKGHPEFSTSRQQAISRAPSDSLQASWNLCPWILWEAMIALPCSAASQWGHHT